MCEKLIDLYKRLSNKMKIYIYPFSPYKNKTIIEFINETINLKSYEWGETYKSWIYIMHYIIHSPLYTTDPSKADLFLVPQWENINRSRYYTNDLILPFKTAMNSKIYKMTHPKRNHLFIYISDDTPLSDKRIPEFIKNELKSRFICITYSGRVNGFGQYHMNNQMPCIYNPKYEIVVPPGIPLNYDIDQEQNNNNNNNAKYCANDFDYKGTLTPEKVMVERYNFLNYMNKNTNITCVDDAYFGIHCAGYGIWTARLYNYLKLGIIPIIPSDGVILPFEKFLNYRAFTVKILSTTYNTNNLTPILFLKKTIDYARKWNNNNIQNDQEYTMDQLQEQKLANRLYKYKQNTIDVSPWFDWKSKYPDKNPFVLLVIELSQFVYNTDYNFNKPIYDAEYFEYEDNDIYPIYNFAI